MKVKNMYDAIGLAQESFKNGDYLLAIEGRHYSTNISLIELGKVNQDIKNHYSTFPKQTKGMSIEELLKERKDWFFWFNQLRHRRKRVNQIYNCQSTLFMHA